MKMIKVDDIIEFCDTERTMLHAHGESTACAALRRLSEYAKDNAVEAEPAKHGRWLYRIQKDATTVGQHGVTYCSECGYVIFTKADKYCAKCGAKMDLKDNEVI